MQFEFKNPTQLVFGAGFLARLGEIAKKYGNNALLVTGGGSVKRTGVFDKAVKSLTDAGLSVFECEGIEPNPRITSVRRGAKIARDNKCDVVIALGGGSTMDASKVIAAAALYDGDPWDMIGHGQENWVIPTEALPIITVPTLAATGSEMNPTAVISDDETKIKSFVGADCLFPKVALVDPELTLTVPVDQTAYGVCDIITHVTEGYFNGGFGTPIQDRFAEGVIINAIEWGEKVVNDGSDLEARTQIQWASILALNGWVQAGVFAAYPVHMIEHALSAHHDITHGAGLAIINPAWMRFSAKFNPKKFAQFAERVFNIDTSNLTEYESAILGIEKLESFLKKIGCPSKLSEVGIDDKLLAKYAEDSVIVAHDNEGRLPGMPFMTKDDIVNVLRSVL